MERFLLSHPPNLHAWGLSKGGERSGLLMESVAPSQKIRSGPFSFPETAHLGGMDLAVLKSMLFNTSWSHSLVVAPPNQRSNQDAKQCWGVFDPLRLGGPVQWSTMGPRGWGRICL